MNDNNPHVPHKVRQDVDLPNAIADNALHRAINRSQCSEVSLLLSYRNIERLLKPLCSGWTALHWASVNDRISPCIVEHLCKRGRSCNLCTMQDSSGRTPLHLACAFGPDPTICALVDACPDAASIQDRRGRTPLQNYVRRDRRHPMTIQKLLWAAPSMVKIPDEEGNGPLHIFFDSIFHLCDSIVIEGRKLGPSRFMEIASLLLWASLRGDAFEAGMGRNSPWLILHASIQENDSLCPWWFVEFLLRNYPQETRKTDDSGNLPLHLSCCSPKLWKRPQLLELLFNSYPNAVFTRNHKGQIPLHIAVARRTVDKDTIIPTTFLLEKGTNVQQQAATKDNYGNLPMHLLCSLGTPFDKTTFNRLLMAYPEALSTRNNQGFTPLHMALIREQSDCNKTDSSTEQPAPRIVAWADREDAASRHDCTPEKAQESESLTRMNFIFELLIRDPTAVIGSAIAESSSECACITIPAKKSKLR